ncbi:hypothetical protein CAPTEDRAFT_196382 [Capitella teleta]|uniref:DDE-1 domain-containing protein n=1 Tax=Capitella teleta TaxID=283909 RepID=R7TEL1_CAPTE|nr:hypothetical protein CAPTEDRAFT_196382 [Capitella teleta]|eukprot:ELT89501.1 hypothetical protein CAPTEDRAFT_196382 [Capitella teleta]
MLEYITGVLSPYCTRVRSQLGLQHDQPALYILDVYRPHHVENVVSLFGEHNIRLMYVPSNCTGELQPLDLSGNADFKCVLKAQFVECTLKPVHAKWVITAWESLNEKPDAILNGWKKAGIASALDVTDEAINIIVD